MVWFYTEKYGQLTTATKEKNKDEKKNWRLTRVCGLRSASWSKDGKDLQPTEKNYFFLHVIHPDEAQRSSYCGRRSE